LVAAGQTQAARFDWGRCAEGLEQLYFDVAAARHD